VDDSVDFDFEMPTLEIEGKKVPLFPVFRAAISAYGDALAFRRHGVHKALPAAISVPTLEQISEVVASGRALHKQLAGAAPALPALPAPAAKPRRSGFESEGGMDEISDAELEELEKGKTA